MYRRKHKRRLNVHVFAGILRKRMTKAEAKLWSRLQLVMVKWDVEFEAQGVVGGRFIADFVCRNRRLIIELDGSIHRLSRVKAKDKYRTQVLTRLGYTIVRFNNTLVVNNCSLVLKQIKDILDR